MNATFTGIHTHDHLLPDWSASARAADAQEMHALHAALLAAWSRTDAITWRRDPDALDAELARANLELRLAEIASGHFVEGNPALWTGEAIFAVVALMIRPFAAAEERVPAIIARLRAIPAFLAPLAETIPTAPAAWIARAQRECEAAQRLFSTGLARWAADAGLSPALAAAIEAAAAPARAAFVATAAVLGALPRVDERPVGVEFLSLALRRGHFVHRSLPELRTAIDHAMREARSRLASMSADAGGWATASAAMAADHPSVDEYLGSFTRRWNECHAHAAAHDLVTWPEWPIRYVPIPAWAQEVAPTLYWLFYRSPAPFDPYSTYDYVVTPIDAALDATTAAARLRVWNHATITLNHVVHHGAIGHHVQNWHATHRSRSRLGTIAAVDCASRIGMFLGGSMAEGWACYATDLMDETGFLTPLERLSEQHTRVRMLARATVDIAYHSGEMTTADAVHYYMEVVGMSKEVAGAEASKNAMFPGTAMMYWLGTDGLLVLRERMRSMAGDTFSLRSFHDAVLQWGAIPVALVAELLTADGT